jgi:hypothetical protein
MGDPTEGKQKRGRTGNYLLRFLLAVVCLIALTALALGIYLASPLPARQVSRILTSYLHQNLSVEHLQTSGGTLYLRGVRLDNPPGYSKGSLATADSIVIAPHWGDLLLGGQRFRVVTLEGIKVALEKNSKGEWNFGQLQQLLAAKKPSPSETFIKQFTLKNGAVTIDGQGVQGIALQIFNLTTKGSRDSKIDLSFEDLAHNRFTLTGKGRAGTEPALDLNLSAPSLSLKEVATLLKLKNPALFEGGTGSLQVTAAFQKGELSTAGNFRFSQLRYSSAKKSYPLTGNLQFAADYSLSRDTLQLKSCQLEVNNLVHMHAVGTVQKVKMERDFTLDLGFNDVELGTLTALIPEHVRENLVFGGRLGCQALHLAGNGSRVTDATGTLRLRDGMLARDGRLYVAGMTGTIGFSRAGSGVLAQGRLSLSGPQEKALLESLEMPFSLRVSRQMKPLRAEIPSLSARIMGIPCTGRFAYDAAKRDPLTASLKVPASRVTTLKPFWERYGLIANSGTASIALDAAGSSPQQLAATVDVRLADFQGSRGGTAFGMKNGVVSAKLRRGDGHLLMQGDAALQGLAVKGEVGDARFHYRIFDQMAYLEAAEVRAAGVRVSVAHLSAALPEVKGVAKATSTPISLSFDGATVKRGALEVSSLSGNLRALLHTDSVGKWLEGRTDLASGRVSWRGKVVAAPSVLVALSRSGAKGELKGTLLGGTLGGSVSGNPFAAQAGASFDLGLKGAEAAAIAPLLPKGSGGALTGGTLDGLRVTGSFSRANGLSCRFDSQGSRIALTGAGGKALVSGAAFNLAGDLAGEKLSVSDAMLSPGQGVALKLKGALDQPFSAQRSGSLTFTLPETAAKGLVAPLINLLPRVIQEATVDGTLAADGKLYLAQGKELLEGSLAVNGGRFELSQQKLLVSGIDGRFPFSLDLSGQPGPKPAEVMPFSRGNYPKLLTELRRVSPGAEILKVGKMSFGPMELGALTLHASAGNGLTQITSLNSTLYDGELFGRGFLTMRKGFQYRGDLLVHDLSLKQFCSIFPGIKGYISGRVDGVVSLSGGSKGLAGLTGFTEIWAHEGSGEKMLVSKEFLQRLAKQKLSGFFFRSDRSYDQAEIKALMESGYLSFQTLQLVHTNFFGVRDLNVSIAPTQNRIALDHLFDSIKQAAVRGKPTSKEAQPAEEKAPAEAPAGPEFKWGE